MVVKIKIVLPNKTIDWVKVQALLLSSLLHG